MLKQCFRSLFIYSSRMRKWPIGFHFIVLVLCLTLLLALLKIRELQNFSGAECTLISTFAEDGLSDSKPIVRFFGSKSTEGHLDIVKSIFKSIGYQIESRNNTEWDVLWSHSYPFQVLFKEMTFLKPHQKVNHFPGSGFITQKANLASLSLKHIPKAFILPDEKDLFLSYAKKNPTVMWIQKSNSHRGIQINDMKNFTFDTKGIFIQEYIKNPLLIDERKFDIGMYVILTSIHPLRVYVYSGDVLLRFCTEKYSPVNQDLLESYVVSDEYLPVWKVPSLKKCIINFGYTAKECLNHYLRSQGKNPQNVWSQIHETIQDVYFKTEGAMKTAALKFGVLRNFFELVRFDFVLDEELNAFLLEANMSPNLSPKHFPPNGLLYEQVILNVLSLTGLAKYSRKGKQPNEPIEISSKDIHVFVEECSSQACQNCKLKKCNVCKQCITKEMRLIAETAFLEHTYRMNSRRLIPKPVQEKKRDSRSTVEDHVIENEINSFMDRWFKGKCLQDQTWCQ